jgi:hypothetical protein
MAEFFFEYNTIPYLFDTELLKLFQIKNKKLMEIDNQEVLREIRLNAHEIDRNRAFKLVKAIME